MWNFEEDVVLRRRGKRGQMDLGKSWITEILFVREGVESKVGDKDW